MSMPGESVLVANPLASYLAHRPEIDSAIARVMHSGIYINGPELVSFEREFAAYLGAAGAVGVANGTDALELALICCGIQPGDKVATVANTVTATVTAIVAAGAQPVFVDIDPVTMLMDPASLRKVLASPDGAKIRVVVPVHLYGLPCAMPEIMKISRDHGCLVIEDCAQAHGSSIKGKMIGLWGDAAAFSFYPTKNLGAFGDAGAVVSQRPDLLERVKCLRQYGLKARYVSVEHGVNSRMDELQAAILRARLPALDADNDRRAAIARHYTAGLGSCPLRLPAPAIDRYPVWHQYVVRSPRRDELRQHLSAAGIGTGIHYPVPVHQQPGYAANVSLPETEKACHEVLSLPIYPSLSDTVIDKVIGAVIQACNSLSP